MNKATAKKVEQKDIHRIKLSDNEYLVVSMVDKRKIDIRIWMETDKYNGPTKRGLRFYLFDGNWDEFKKAVDKVDRTVVEIA